MALQTCKHMTAFSSSAALCDCGPMNFGLLAIARSCSSNHVLPHTHLAGCAAGSNALGSEGMSQTSFGVLGVPSH